MSKRTLSVVLALLLANTAILPLLAQDSKPATGGGSEVPKRRPPPPPPDHREKDETLLSNVRQFTFDGEKSGESYFSPDSRTICFQSVRGDCPHYQIFVQRLDSTRLVRVSPGQGLTTCSYFHPTEPWMIWASTHLDPATYGPPPPNLGPYAWDKHPSFDVFRSDFEGKGVVRLTNTPGYDAEGSISPDGKRICFTSERDGDLEIYTMAADGTDVQRVTNSKGYDGGPFYSPDGKRICFRGFRDAANPRHAQIFTINVDGTDEKQLTSDQATNWAPYYDPTGHWLVYSKNLGSDRNFELFLVPSAGGESIRVTTHPGADVLPVFSPDGKKLMWTSTRVGERSQIFIGDLSMPNLPK